MTTIRSQTATTLAAVYKSALDHAEAARAALIDSLPSQMRQVLKFVEQRCEYDEAVTTVEVSVSLKFSQTYAGSMLKELCDYGLLKRSQPHTELGYVYSPKRG